MDFTALPLARQSVLIICSSHAFFPTVVLHVDLSRGSILFVCLLLVDITEMEVRRRFLSPDPAVY